MFCRKCLLFGEVTVLYIGELSRYDLEGAVEYEYTVPARLVRILLSFEDLVRSGFIMPLPAAISTRRRPREEDLKDLSNWSTLENRTGGPVSRGLHTRRVNYVKESFPTAINAAMTHKQLIVQLNEIEVAHHAFEVTQGRLLAPSVAHLTTQSLLRLRGSEPEAFGRFQRQLKRLLKNSSETKGDKALLDLMKETDAEVHALEETMRSQRREAQLSLGLGLAGLTTSALLVAVAPQELAQTVRDVAGTYSLVSLSHLVLEKLPKVRERYYRRADFYFPWLIGSGQVDKR